MVISILCAVVVAFLAVWAWGAWLNRRDAKHARAVSTAAEMQADYDYRLQQAERKMLDMLPGLLEEAVAHGAYYAAAHHGFEPVMPARNAMEAREQRLAARAVRDADRASESYVDLDALVDAPVATVGRAAVDVEAGVWWAQSAGHPGTLDSDADHAPADDTVAASSARGWGLGEDRRWDVVRRADGRVPASMVLASGPVYRPR